MGRGWFFGLGGDDAEFDGDEFDDVLPPFWETDVVQLTERDRREVNLYEGLQPLWPKLGQLMVRRDDDDDDDDDDDAIPSTRARSSDGDGD